MPTYFVTEDVTVSKERSEDGRVAAHTIRIKLHSFLSADNEEAAREAVFEKKYPGFVIDNAQVRELPDTPEIKALVVDARYEDSFSEEIE